MKNVANWQLKKCIFKDEDDFLEDIQNIYGEDAEVECDSFDGVSVCINDDYVLEEDLNKKLSDYYECKVTSVHMDDFGPIGIWICYA